MLFRKRRFSGSVINYLNPCTISEGRLCDVFANISLWNKFFWQVGLQLRELSPGELSLVEVHCGYVGLSMLQQQGAATLLCHLLSHHRCIVSVHLNYQLLKYYHPIICDALRRSSTLTQLKLCPPIMNASLSFAAALPQMNQLQALELSRVPLNRTTLAVLSEFLATTRSLTTFTVTDNCMEGEDAVVVLQGLRKNVTISTLSIDSSLLSTVSSRCGEIFADYVRCNQTLRCLTMASRARLCFNNLGPVIGALFYNSILSELNLVGFSIHVLDNKVITYMLSCNQGLRRFHMANCKFDEYNNCMNTCVPTFSSESSLISLWLAALAKNNRLEELTMGLLWIKPEDCSSFFRALASHKSLKKVNIPQFRQSDVVQICGAIRDTGVPERFFVGEHEVLRDTAAVLPECKALSRIRLYLRTSYDVELMHTTLRLLPSCRHVKSLSLEMAGEMFNGKVSSLIAQYLTDTTTLRELRLKLFSGPWHSFDRALLKALSKNNSIRRLLLEGLCINEYEAEMLTDMLQSSRTLCHLSYQCDSDSTASFLGKLSPNISSNYMLLGLYVNWNGWFRSDWHPIRDVVRRNNSLVTRAAHFVMGTRRRYCAAAAELMQFSPGLVEKVQELASIDEEDAVSRIEGSLQSFTELHDFMCLAGVVKKSIFRGSVTGPPVLEPSWYFIHTAAVFPLGNGRIPETMVADILREADLVGLSTSNTTDEPNILQDRIQNNAPYLFASPPNPIVPPGPGTRGMLDNLRDFPHWKTVLNRKRLCFSVTTSINYAWTSVDGINFIDLLRHPQDVQRYSRRRFVDFNSTTPLPAEQIRKHEYYYDEVTHTHYWRYPPPGQKLLSFFAYDNADTIKYKVEQMLKAYPDDRCIVFDDLGEDALHATFTIRGTTHEWKAYAMFEAVYDVLNRIPSP